MSARWALSILGQMSQDQGASGSATSYPSQRPPHRPWWALVGAAVLVVVIVVVVVIIALTGLFGDDSQKGPGHRGPVVELRATPGDLPPVLDATQVSLREYWSEEFERVHHKPFRDLAGGWQPKTPKSPPWTCQDQRLTYQDIRGNAFYCGGKKDDYIAYDAAFLLPQLNKSFGALTPAVVLAHEMGHAVQARAGVDAPSILIELQADCFAGAWVADVQSSDAAPVAIDGSALDASIRAIPLLRDQPGTPATNPQAHGLAFDRVNAFQTGYEKGAVRCATVPKGDVAVTELPFSTPEEAATGGNIDLAEAVPFFATHLDGFWAANLQQLSAGASYSPPRRAVRRTPPLPSCPHDSGYDRAAATTYCGPSNTVALATTPLVRLYAAIGDMAPGAAMSLSWARAAQEQAHLSTTGDDAELQRVCFTGTWIAEIASGTSSVRLSPGDVDEVLLSVLSPLSPTETRRVETTSFERTDALRAGLLEGLGACMK
jgi:predicted metalloprotease